MEEEGEAWESLDVDDSDIPSLLRPCKRHQHSTAQSQPTPLTLIPGPAGALQAAMNRNSRGPLSTQEYLRKAVQDAEDDFSLDPWLCALDFLRQEGLVDPRGLLLTMPLKLIGEDGTIERVPLVVAVVKSCTSNGLGDMMVTLKDPTGTVGASIHHTVLNDGDFGKDISVGAVLVLKQVAVFSLSRTANYLNITPSNVVKLISKACGPRLEENCRASTVEHMASASVSESRETSSRVPEKVLSRLHGRTQDIVNGLRKDVEQSEEHSTNTEREGQSVAVRAQSDGNQEQEEVVAVNLQTPHSSCQFISNSNDHQRAEVCNDKWSINGVKKAVTVLPQWTEEQLEELFTFDD